MPDGSNPVDKLFYTVEQAAEALVMGLDAVEDWMASGHLKYACEKARGKRRIWWEDLLAFGKWYREEHLQCPSTRTKTPLTGSTTFNVVDVDFSDRSTAKTVARPYQRTGQNGKPRKRKRSLEIGLRQTQTGSPA